MKLRVIDLFCGPGGFSTGFEAAGFEVVAALDYNKDAVRTYSANHKFEARVQDLKNFDYQELPDAEIVIGGPPCTQFSSVKSNKTRNVLDGLLLVQSFLRCVYQKKPEFWIMENVPTIQKYLPQEIPLRFIGIDEDGNLEIPQKIELVAADYGVPQKRKRYLIGNFPIPEPSHYDKSQKSMFTPIGAKEWRSMGQALSWLPDPLCEPNGGMVDDPNHDLSIPANQLSDHHYDTRFSEIEQRSIKMAKTQHPYMGRLSWPDRFDRPARTVVATQLGRETLVLQANETDFRRATVRECATLQSFPISYQFFGRSFGSKYRQAGDAVPPLLSYALAKEIRSQRGMEMIKPLIRKEITEFANVIPTEKLRKKRKPNFRRKANFLVPAKEVRGTRCELFVDHFSDQTTVQMDHSFRSPNWRTDLVLGEGFNSTARFHVSKELCNGLNEVLLANGKTQAPVISALAEWEQVIQNFESGDEVYACHVLENFEKSPLRLIEIAKSIADENLPSSEFHVTQGYLLKAKKLLQIIWVSESLI